MTKRCTKCGGRKRPSAFHKDSTKSDGLHTICRDCRNSSRSRKSSRKSNLKRKYGITVEQYDARLQLQNGCCAICGTEPGDKRLAVDHCHDSSRVRGLLCSACNTALGLLKEDSGIIRRAAMYVLAHQKET